MGTRLNRTSQEERPPSLTLPLSLSLSLLQTYTYTTHVIICFMLSYSLTILYMHISQPRCLRMSAIAQNEIYHINSESNPAPSATDSSPYATLALAIIFSQERFTEII